MDLQQSVGLNLLTVSEAADYLRMGERKLYELVAEGGVPCTKVTGKWLFPRAELDRWLLSGLARPAGMVPADFRKLDRKSGLPPLHETEIALMRGTPLSQPASRLADHIIGSLES